MANTCIGCEVEFTRCDNCDAVICSNCIGTCDACNAKLCTVCLDGSTCDECAVEAEEEPERNPIEDEVIP